LDLATGQETANWKSGQMNLLAEWEPFCGIWPRWGLSVGGEVYELPKWEPAMGARGSSSSLWPTATANPATYTGGNAPGYQCLPGAAERFWPTSRAEDSESTGAHRGAPDTLTSAVALWRTPDAPKAGGVRTHADSQGQGHQVTIAEQAEFWQTPSADSFRRANELGLTDQCLESVAEHFWKTPHGLTYSPEAGDPGGGGEFAEQATRWKPCLWGTPKYGTNAGQGQENPKRGSRIEDQALAFSLPAHQIQSGLTFWQRVHILLRLCRQLRQLLPSPYNKARSIFKRKLNPDFVDWLIGWPVGWSSEDRGFSAEEMESYRFRRQQCLRFLLGGSA
jgi:hypothetical protein